MNIEILCNALATSCHNPEKLCMVGRSNCPFSSIECQQVDAIDWMRVLVNLDCPPVETAKSCGNCGNMEGGKCTLRFGAIMKATSYCKLWKAAPC